MSIDLNLVVDSLFTVMVKHAEERCLQAMTFTLFRDGEPPIVDTLPPDYGFLLSDGEAKDVIFAWWRERCKDPRVAAFACGSEAWMFEENEQARELMETDPEGFRKLIDHGFNHMLALGLGTRYEAITATAQSRERVIVASRRFERRRGKIVWTAEVIRDEFPQANFKGRQKMWGDLSPQNLR